MNRIKSAERSKLKKILNALMFAYTAREEEKLVLDAKTLSEEISLKVWKKTRYKKPYSMKTILSSETKFSAHFVYCLSKQK